MQFAAMNSVALRGLPRADAGSGNSLFSMIQMMAVGLGVTVGGGLVTGIADRYDSAMLGFRWSFAIVGLVTLLSGWVFRQLSESAT